MGTLGCLKKDIAKNYVYMIKYDKGFAPNIEYGICILGGCKSTIERCAKKGIWIIGIGGNKTGKPNKLIYAMEVEEALPHPQFRERYRKESNYLPPEKAKNVLISKKKFYYFGDKAIDLPESLKHIIIAGQGCKCVSDKDIIKLKEHLTAERYIHGISGKPNNQANKTCFICPKFK